MTRRKFVKSVGGAGAVAALTGGGHQARAADEPGEPFSLDVCINGTTFVFQGPTHDDGTPDFGSPFIVEGVIYPEGTLSAKGADSGVLEDGTPEFPDEVIGKWTCWGMHVGAGGLTAEGIPWVVTTQIYDLDVDNPGAKTLISNGYERPGLDLSTSRGLIGARASSRCGR